MPPDLWARFDMSCEQGDLFHLMISDLTVASSFGVEVACCERVLSNDAYLDDVLIDASRTVEHRKKCPVCYQYWMKRREQRYENT